MTDRTGPPLRVLEFQAPTVEPDPTMVERAEELVAMVKAGQVLSVAIAAELTDGCYSTTYVLPECASLATLLLALRTVDRDVMENVE